MRWILLIVAAVQSSLMAGCMMPSAHVAVAPQADLSALKTVAVWRFRDGGRISNSGDVATRAVESVLIKQGLSVGRV